MEMSDNTPVKPWYRQPMVWLVVGIPGTAVIVGLSLLTLSLNIDLGLVSDDYYKRGKAINVDLSKDKRAHELGFRGMLNYNINEKKLAVTLASTTGVELPQQIKLDIMHATLGEKDIEIDLNSQGSGLYQATLKNSLPVGPWEVRLSSKEWRIHGRIKTPDNLNTSLLPLY